MSKNFLHIQTIYTGFDGWRRITSRDELSYLKIQFVAAMPLLNEMFEKQIICSSFEFLTEKCPFNQLMGPSHQSRFAWKLLCVAD
jgi:hypothetical protein